MVWTGAVYRDRADAIANFCVQHDHFGRNLGAVCPNPWNLHFAVSGPDAGEVRAVVEAVGQAADRGNLAGPHSADAQDQPGDHYVYAYFGDGNPTSNQCFYVGKGTRGKEQPHAGRWTQHIRDALGSRRNLPNEKTRRINEWICARGLVDLGAASVIRAAAGSLVRKLYVFSGEYAKSLAFYTEYFLINHALGIYFVANDTNGNSNCGECSAIVLPKHLNHADARHELLWRSTVEEFTRNPRSPTLINTWRPASIAMFAAPYAEALDSTLEPFGVVPHPMHGQGRLADELMPRPNIQVTGAADATLTYSHPRRPYYRLELRFGATQCITSISLRPYAQTRERIAAFLDYMDRCEITNAAVDDVHTIPGCLSERYGCEVYVKNRQNWPFYKPYALGAQGRQSTWFEIADPNARGSGATNWINGPFELGLDEGVNLIIQAFN